MGHIICGHKRRIMTTPNPAPEASRVDDAAVIHREDGTRCDSPTELSWTVRQGRKHLTSQATLERAALPLEKRAPKRARRAAPKVEPAVRPWEHDLFEATLDPSVALKRSRPARTPARGSRGTS